ncbi:uncharacterized protein RJT20DRAFT_115064 [Scheffersomyces xylosifermentans]|uniref:uncharacterized protein n=1 Tax=Scheffersomyces xylosifermentans TaxID=1304137 RepID=UPI00315D85F1
MYPIRPVVSTSRVLTPLVRFYATTNRSSTIRRNYASTPVYTRVGSTRSSSKAATETSESSIDESELSSNGGISTAASSTPKSGVSFNDSPIIAAPTAPGEPINWSDSFHGLGSVPFPREVADILLAPIADEDIEIKPDGLLYLPEIKYRRILNRAFGPGGWGLAPRTETLITPKQLSREYALICHGRLVSVARGEQDYFGGEEKVTTALEGCKSNALMRCCKDLGIASELWDPSFIRAWKKKYCDEVFAEHVTTKKKKKLWKLKKNKTLDYPYKLT